MNGDLDAPETSFTAITGRLVVRPALAYEDGGTAVVRLQVRTHDELGVVYDVSARGEAAENAASDLSAGDPVLVHGALGLGAVDDGEGEREARVLHAVALGPDLTHTNAKVLGRL